MAFKRTAVGRALSEPGGIVTRTRLTQLTRLTAGYSLAAFAGPLFTILLTPLYTRILRPDDYAVLDTVTTLGLLITALATLGLNAAMGVFFYDGDAAHANRVLLTASAVGVGWSLLIALVLVIIAQPLATFTLGDPRWALLIYLSAINLPFAVLAALFQTGLRLRLAVARANTLALANLGLTIALNILFVLILRLGVLGIQLTTMITTLVLVIGGGLLLRNTKADQEQLPAPSRPWFEPGMASDLVRAGLPFVPASLSFWALAYLDRLLLPAYAIALDERGLYAIAAKLASMLAIIVVPFQNAWGPLALSMRDAPEAPRTYVKVATYFAAAGLGIALGLALFARELLLIFTTPVYADAAPYVIPLAYVAVANGIGVALGVGIYLQKRTGIAGLATLVGAATNLLLNLVLIPRFGVWGAAWATAIGYLLVPVTLYIGAQRVYPLPFELAKILVALAAQASILFIGTSIHTGYFWLDAGLKLVLLPVYALLLILLRVIEPHELRLLANLIAQRLRPAQ